MRSSKQQGEMDDRLVSRFCVLASLLLSSSACSVLLYCMRRRAILAERRCFCCALPSTDLCLAPMISSAPSTHLCLAAMVSPAPSTHLCLAPVISSAPSTQDRLHVVTSPVEGSLETTSAATSSSRTRSRALEWDVVATGCTHHAPKHVASCIQQVHAPKHVASCIQQVQQKKRAKWAGVVRERIVSQAAAAQAAMAQKSFEIVCNTLLIARRRRGKWPSVRNRSTFAERSSFSRASRSTVPGLVHVVSSESLFQ